jgi:hypothetical protein
MRRDEDACGRDGGIMSHDDKLIYMEMRDGEGWAGPGETETHSEIMLYCTVIVIVLKSYFYFLIFSFLIMSPFGKIFIVE